MSEPREAGKWSKTAWTTQAEMDVIDYMGSSQRRMGPGNRRPTVSDRRKKLKTWLETAQKRVWGNSGINVDKCYDHAQKLLEALPK